MSQSILDRVLSLKHADEISHFVPQDILTRLLAPLTSRERDVLSRRFGLQGGKVATLEEIGTSLEVTRERVRQIERSAIKRVRESTSFSGLITTVEHVIGQYLEEAGGALAQEELYERLSAGRDHPEETRLIIKFFIQELLLDRFQRIPASDSLREGWAMRLLPLAQLQGHIAVLQQLLEEKNTPLDFTTIARLYRERRPKDTLSDEQLQAILWLSSALEHNVFGQWGLASWVTIHPKRMKDKIYLVLKQHGKPLHFQEITRLINEAKFDQKTAYAPTVHNELIMDERFVLVGRGMYALSEWGFKPGIVADVIADILGKEPAPLHRDAVVRKVLEQRFVGKATIHLALMNRERFTKLPDGRYTLTQKTSTAT